MFLALLILHVLAAILLIFVVLLQSGRGAELGAAFGGVGQATFGRGQSTFITKFTTGIAVVFMATSLSLAFLTVERPSTSVMDAAAVQQPAAVDETPQTGTLQTPPPSRQTDGGTEDAEPPTRPLEQTDAPPRPGQSDSR